jgi:hypothetical protein
MILSKLKSLQYKDIDQEKVMGLDLIIQYKDDKVYSYTFCGDRVNINGKYYDINHEEDESMSKLYDTLHYKEKTSKP